MGRFLAPILAFSAAGYVWWSNRDATTEFLYLFPMNAVYDDPALAGQRSWQALLVIGSIWLATDLRALVVARRAAKDEAQPK